MNLNAIFVNSNQNFLIIKSIKTFLFLFSLLLVSKTTFAQKLEIGASTGLLQYRGDLQPRYNLFSGLPGAGLFVRYNLVPALSFKAQGVGGFMSGKDKRTNAPLHRQRNYEFSGLMLEYGGQIEYNFLDFRTSRSLRKAEGSPYLFLGYSSYSLSNIKYQYLNSTIPSFSYVQGIPGTSTSGNTVQFGVGYKKIWKSNWNIGVEFGARKLFTDVFDKFGYVDSSKSGYGPNRAASATGFDLALKKNDIPNDHMKDMYYYLNFSLSYVFYKVHCPNPR